MERDDLMMCVNANVNVPLLLPSPELRGQTPHVITCIICWDVSCGDLLYSIVHSELVCNDDSKIVLLRQQNESHMEQKHEPSEALWDI